MTDEEMKDVLREIMVLTARKKDAARRVSEAVDERASVSSDIGILTASLKQHKATT